jgi:hypothetical protein
MPIHQKLRDSILSALEQFSASKNLTQEDTCSHNRHREICYGDVEI